jgi:hypothetical protein
MGGDRGEFPGFPQETFFLPRELWLFYGIDFHATLLAPNGIALFKGKTTCIARLGLARYDDKR